MSAVLCEWNSFKLPSVWTFTFFLTLFVGQFLVTSAFLSPLQMIKALQCERLSVQGNFKARLVMGLQVVRLR